MQQPIIHIQNLTKRFKGIFALKEINLTINRGDVFGIIGMSGAGKSTLIRCMSRLENPSEGQIFFDDVNITTCSTKEMKEIRKNIGMIFQHFNLFSSRTSLENVMYPLEIDGIAKQEQIERARGFLKRVGLKEKEGHYPEQLSGGEKQRVAIARSLVRSPQILFCDEATSALDPRTTHSILELLSQLNEELKLTIVLITHEMEVIKQICTRVAVLEYGEVVEQGSVADLFSTAKHPTTKRFLQNLTHAIPDRLLPKENNQELLHLTFTSQSVNQPVISQMIRSCNIEVNILLGGIDVLKMATVGNLVIAIEGTPEERLKACRFLENNGVLWERVG